MRTLEVTAAGSLFHVLRSAESQEEVGKGEPGGIVDALGFGTFLAQVHLLHLVPDDLGQVHFGFAVFANATLHS
jgi:hypothetical protein